MSFYLVLSLILGVAQTNASVQKGTVERIKVHGKS